MTRQHCNRLIASAKVMDTVEPIGSKPATESQARELSELPAAQQAAAWQEAVENVKHVSQIDPPANERLRAVVDTVHRWLFSADQKT